MKRRPVTITVLFLASIAIAVFIFSCRRYKDGPAATALPQVIPSAFPQPVYKFQDNPLTQQGFELGKKLFYDGRLSLDGNFPCASCHQQTAIFGTFEHDRSHGYGGSHTLRNAPPLFNLAWQKEFHWDGQFKTLYSEATQPITTHNEMAGDLGRIVMSLSLDTGYQRLCRAAFGSPLLTEDRMLKALAQFTGYIVSNNSKYDRVKRGDDVFTATEQNGYQLYQTKCATCHPEPLFTDYSYRNNGLPVDSELNDYGRMRVTHDPADSLKFKVPSLRNVNLTSNYMHDGRFNTLTQVLNHYSTGIQSSSTLDPLLVNKIPLTTTEKSELNAFLKTLSDSTILHDPRYTKPG
jgi:cytochrome c peroxidase